MKTLRAILLFGVTLCVLVFGFFLPGVVFDVQSGRQDDIKRYEVQTIQLSTADPVDITDALRLVAGAYYAVPLETGNVLDKEGAYAAALATLEYIDESGVEGVEWTDFDEHAESCYFMASETGDNAAVIWQCELYDSEFSRYVYMLIDDVTGLMLSLSVSDTDMRIAQPGLTNVVQWLEMCEGYYGFVPGAAEIISQYEYIEELPYPNAYTGDSRKNHILVFYTHDGGTIELQYTIMFPYSVLTDGQGTEYAINPSGYISFN